MHYTEIYRGYVVSIVQNADQRFCVFAEAPHSQADIDETNDDLAIEAIPSMHFETLTDAFGGVAGLRGQLALLPFYQRRS